MVCGNTFIKACLTYFTLTLVYNDLWFHRASIADAREVNNLRTLIIVVKIIKILSRLIAQDISAQRRLTQMPGTKSVVLLTNRNICFRKLGTWLSNCG